MESNLQPRGIAIIARHTAVPRGPGIPGSPDHRIRPGIGAGGVRLGMTEGQVLRVLGAPERRSTNDGLVTIAWVGISVRCIAGPGGRVIEVEVTDRGIRTDEGIGVGSTMAEVEGMVPAPECEPACPSDRTDEALPGDRVTTFRLDDRRTVIAIEVGRILG